MKKFKMNDRGFMLVETLIVAVFAAAIFSIIYSNYYPIMAEYERRESFDDVDGKYGIYWIKKIIQSNSVNFGDKTVEGTIAYNIENENSTTKYHQFDCDTDIEANDVATINMCNQLIEKLEIVRRKDDGTEVEKGSKEGKPCIYITLFKLEDFKQKANDEAGSGIFSGNLSDYVAYLPSYSNTVSLNRAKYRVIVEYHRTKDDNDYYAYSTIEVKK